MNPNLYLAIIRRRAEANAILADKRARPSLVALACAFLLQWGP